MPKTRQWRRIKDFHLTDEECESLYRFFHHIGYIHHRRFGEVHRIANKIASHLRKGRASYDKNARQDDGEE